MIKIIINLFCITAIISGSANAREVDLKIGVLHFPPFYVVSTKDGVSGIYIDILQKVLDRAGYNYSFDGFPPKRFYTQLGDNTTNLFIGVRGSKHIEGKVAFGDMTFEGIQLRAYSMNNNKIITKKEELVSQLPIFALTADVTQNNIYKCLSAGMNKIISKPIKHDELSESLRIIQYKNSVSLS